MVVLSSRRRREEMVKLATTGGLANVADLADTFAVSPSTIRRDLARLEAEGQLTRTYGGADGQQRPRRVQSPATDRRGVRRQAGNRSLGRGPDRARRIDCARRRIHRRRPRHTRFGAAPT